jgi:hypothetical protein
MIEVSGGVGRPSASFELDELEFSTSHWIRQMENLH